MHQNGDASFIGATTIIEEDSFAYMKVKSPILNPKNVINSELQTDSAIQKHQQREYGTHLDGRDLTAVSSNWLEPDAAVTFDNNAKWDMGKWDQFEANKQLFNVKSTFDENLYTKKLDISKISRDQLQKAERIAREIEGTVSSNIHLREERGHAQEREMNEEDMYSGVVREDAYSNNTNSHKPLKHTNSGGKEKFNRGRHDVEKPAETENVWRRGEQLSAGPTTGPVKIMQPGPPNNYGPGQGPPNNYGPGQGPPNNYGPGQGPPNNYGPGQGPPNNYGPGQGMGYASGPPMKQTKEMNNNYRMVDNENGSSPFSENDGRASNSNSATRYEFDYRLYSYRTSYSQLTN